MPSVIATEMQSLVRHAAEPIKAGETVKAQMVRSWERLGRPTWWRIKACWYGESGGFSAQAVRDIQARYRLWREAETRRAAHAAEVEQLTRDRLDREALEATRAEYRSELARIEQQLAACDETFRF